MEISVSIITGKKINRDRIYEALQLDRISYDEIYQLQLDTCVGYFEKNNDIYIMALDDQTKHVIGYINFSPVDERLFKGLMSGSVVDAVITKNDILQYQDSKMFWGYFSSIVVHPDYRRIGVATKMLNAWSELVLRLVDERDIFFKGIVADAVSDAGVQLLYKVGFSFVKASNHESKIMTLDFFSQDTIRTSFNSKILETYKNKRKKAVN